MLINSAKWWADPDKDSDKQKIREINPRIIKRKLERATGLEPANSKPRMLIMKVIALVKMLILGGINNALRGLYHGCMREAMMSRIPSSQTMTLPKKK